jgi:hypothetical protein
MQDDVEMAGFITSCSWRSVPSPLSNATKEPIASVNCDMEKVNTMKMNVG